MSAACSFLHGFENAAGHRASGCFVTGHSQRMRLATGCRATKKGAEQGTIARRPLAFSLAARMTLGRSAVSGVVAMAVRQSRLPKGEASINGEAVGERS
jgi:hypothetical protein